MLRDAAYGAGKVKSSDVIVWDSMARKAKGNLGPMGDVCMLDTLHQAASIVREHNTGAAKKALEDNGLNDDPTLLTALEALLNVLPAAPGSGTSTKLDAHLAGAASDWEALEKLRRLAFAEQVPEPKRQMLLPLASAGDGRRVRRKAIRNNIGIRITNKIKIRILFRSDR